MPDSTAALAGAVKANARKRASQPASERRRDAAHGETTDPAWALSLADELEAAEAWLAPDVDGCIKARTATGRYTAYEMPESAAAGRRPAHRRLTLRRSSRHGGMPAWRCTR